LRQFITPLRRVFDQTFLKKFAIKPLLKRLALRRFVMQLSGFSIKPSQKGL
jgi:hypothetical protein